MVCRRHRHRGRRYHRAAHQIQRRRPMAPQDQSDGQRQMRWRLETTKHRKHVEKMKQAHGPEGDRETSQVATFQ